MTRRWSRKGFGFSCIVAAVVLVAGAMNAQAATKADVVTMDELLDAEGIGNATFAPDGQSLAFARQMPVTSHETWGFDDAALLRQRINVMGLHDRRPREIADDANIRYSLLPEKGWAPDGRGLLLLATTRQGYGLAYYDLTSGKVTVLPGRQANFFPTFDWGRNGLLVYATVSEDVFQRGNNGQVRDNLHARWDGGWNGAQPQVTVSSANPVFETSKLAEGDLVAADLHSGTTTILAHGNYIAVAVAPDGARVAAVRAAEPMSAPLNFTGRRGALELFALASAQWASLQHYDDIDVAQYGGLSWSPSGGRLLAIGRRNGAEGSESHAYLIDGASGKRDEIAADGLSFIDPGASSNGVLLLPAGWIGEQPLAIAAKQDANAKEAATSPSDSSAHLQYGESQHLRFDAYAFEGGRPVNLTAFAKASVKQFLSLPDDSGTLVVADGALWKLQSDREPQRLSPADAPLIVGFGVDARYPEPPMRSAYYRAGDDERVGVYGLDAQGVAQRMVLDVASGRIAPLKAQGDIVATAPDQRTTMSMARAGWTSKLLLNDATGERGLLLVNEALRDKAVGQVESFDYAYKGKSLKGWIVLPPGAKPGQALPAIVSVYGGMVYSGRIPSSAKPNSDTPIFSGQLLATLGYAVIYPSTPLGQGSDTDVMETLAGEVVSAIDAAAGRGWVDAQRVGVIGQSFGGYSTAAILAKRSDRFRAGIAMAGIYDWIYSYGMLPMDTILFDNGNIADVEMKMVESGQIRLAQPFWKSPDAYMRNSPAFHIEDIDAPLLLLHGDLDLGVTGLPGAERMYNLMLRAGKKPALVRYWGQGHVAQSAWALRDQWQRITTWFDHYVKPASAPRIQQAGD